MKWPSHTDYQDAIQDPHLCFEEPELKSGQAACDMFGLPRVTSGNFASVYEMVSGEKKWAVRCFVRQVSGTQARYARLGEHLSKMTLPWLVDFEFLLKGIRVQNDWFPIVKMQWVEGWPLNIYVEQHLNEPERLRDLARQFRKLVADLRQHKIAHGDFQHGNIMVTPKHELRLVDYDGMYCPAFGKGRSPELGHANFQHPLRLPDYYDESLDNFSALVIYTSLLALAADPGLWKDYYTGDNLLLSSGDYRNTQNSKGFDALLASADSEVRDLAAVLRQACRSPIAMTPWFEETLQALENGTLQTMEGPLPTATTTATGGAAQKQGDGWWENAQAHTTFQTRSGTRPTGTAVAASGGTRPATPPATAATSNAGTTGGSRAAASLAPSGTSGTRPAEALSGPDPVTTTTSFYPPAREEAESGLGFKLMVGAAVLVLVALLWYALAASRARNALAQPPETEAVDER